MSALTLAARGVRKSFGGVEVLHGVDLDVAGGSILALLGENGAGKSTLVKILAGEYSPDSAQIEIGGQMYSEMNPRSARAAGIRMIFQEFQDASTLSVAENVSLGRLPTRGGFVVSKSRMRKRAARVLGEMNVGLCFGLLQFASTITLTVCYLSWGRRRFDAHAARLRAQLEEGQRR